MSKELGKPGRGDETPKHRVSPPSDSPIKRRGESSREAEKLGQQPKSPIKRRGESSRKAEKLRQTHIPSINEIKRVSEHSELQMQIEQLAEDIWGQLSSEAQNALETLEALASRLQESG
jgi:hypothetical protein